MALTIFALGACLGAWLGSSIAGDVAERGGVRERPFSCSAFQD